MVVRTAGSVGVFHGYILRISFQDYVYFLFLLNASIILSEKVSFTDPRKEDSRLFHYAKADSEVSSEH